VISKIVGTLTGVDEDSAYVEAGGLVYQVFVPLYIRGELAAQLDGSKKQASFFTVHYIEGAIGGGAMVPRLIGFLTREDREFFRVFTTVKGIGMRKALRSLSIPTAQLVLAIESGNRPLLTQLPEIGPRTADRIIAELKGKLAKFASPAPETPAETLPDSELAEQAREILMLQLHYTRSEAETMVARVLRENKDLKTVKEILEEVFRLQRSGR